MTLTKLNCLTVITQHYMLCDSTIWFLKKSASVISLAGVNHKSKQESTLIKLIKMKPFLCIKELSLAIPVITACHV